MEAIAAELGEERRARVGELPRRVGDRVPGPGEIGSRSARSSWPRSTRPTRSAQLPMVEGLADLAAMALERTSLLETEGQRARDELG